VFPVRYGLDFYILNTRYSVFKGLMPCQEEFRNESELSNSVQLSRTSNKSMTVLLSLSTNHETSITNAYVAANRPLREINDAQNSSTFD
jgi:hypothetical protein